MNYLYDGSWEGFLTCVFEHYYSEKAVGVFPEERYQLDLCERALSVATDEEKAARVLEAITNKISKWDAERLYRAHLTGEPGIATACLRYIRLGFKRGSRIRLLHGNETVLAVQSAERRLGDEVHRLLGILRFSEKLSFAAKGDEVTRILYAPIEPNSDCLEFLAPHFTDRFKEEPFIIHDLRREKALFAYRKEWRIAPLEREEAEAIPDSADEAGYVRLWKNYFDTLAIKERTNPRCQRNFLPSRYRKHLTEMK